LLNLTSLPDLINLETVGTSTPAGGAAPQRPIPGGSGPGGGGQYGGPQGGPPSGGPGPGGGYSPPGGQRTAPPQMQAPPQVSAPPVAQPSASSVPPRSQAAPSAPPATSEPVAQAESTPETPSVPPEPIAPSEATPTAEAVLAEPVQSVPTSGSASVNGRNWDGFLEFVGERNGQSGVKVSLLRLNDGKLMNDELVITCKSKMQCSQLSEKPTLMALDTLTREYFGATVEVRVETGDIAVRKSDKQLQIEAEDHAGVNKVMETFGAQMISVSPRKQ